MDTSTSYQDGVDGSRVSGEGTTLGAVLTGALVGVGLIGATAAAWMIIPHSPLTDPLVVTVLWINAILAAVAIAFEVSRRPYSLNLLHLVCMYLFLGVAGLLQYTRGHLAVPGSIITVEDQIFIASISTTLWLAGYLVGYELQHRRRRAPVGGFFRRPLVLTRVVLLGCMGLVGLVYLAAVGMLGASTRGAAGQALTEFSQSAGVGGMTQPLFIINTNLARALPAVSLMAVLLGFARSKGTMRMLLFPLAAALGVGTLLADNPFAASRVFFTTILIAFVAAFFLRRLRTGTLAVVAIGLGLTILPALGQARRALDLSEVASYFALMSPIDYLSKSGDVDSLGMTALCQEYVDNKGHRWGAQFAGAALFWVPRMFWSSKPIGTGALVTRELGFGEFTNYAPPIQAEFLVDFGLLGVLIGGALFGIVLAWLDSVYWSVGREGLARSRRLIDVFYPFWLGCIVFITRGDFLSAFVFTVSFSVWLIPLGFRQQLPGSEDGDYVVNPLPPNAIHAKHPLP